MSIKKIISTLLAMTFVVAFTLSLSATESDNFSAGCVETQYARLQELLRGEFVVPFSADGEPVNVPRLNMIIPPEGNRSYFLIGMYDTVTQGYMDFILSYTGIPAANVRMGQGFFQHQVSWRYIDDECDSSLELLTEYADYHAEIAPLALTLPMGTMIDNHFSNRIAAFTLGHPVRGSRSVADTAPHTTAAANRPVTRMFHTLQILLRNLP